MNRRNFLRVSGLAAGAVAVGVSASPVARSISSMIGDPELEACEDFRLKVMREMNVSEEDIEYIEATSTFRHYENRYKELAQSLDEFHRRKRAEHFRTKDRLFSRWYR